LECNKLLVRQRAAATLRRRGKIAFLSRLHPDSSIFDVGCGSNSPYSTKQILPKCKYTGIDIGDHNQTKPNLSDRYIIAEPINFAGEIAKLTNTFDAVVSSHNLEHCNDRHGTLRAMLAALKPNGLIYVSFPCEPSTHFPKRKGCLNYYDDETHKYAPPAFDEVITELNSHGFEILFAARRYRPLILRLIGLCLEPLSQRKQQILTGTWEFYGFESVIWARKIVNKKMKNHESK
jgi:SAM-dependent methyltransferase